MINTPGIYSDITAAEYHADPCEVPSLSSSLAVTLLGRSPRHAWFDHPRLNKDRKKKAKYDRPMEIGTVAHKLILEAGADVLIIEAENYASTKARELREAAYAAGQAPILAPDWYVAQGICEAVYEVVPEVEWGKGRVEEVIIWEDSPGVWCRAMLDWWRMNENGTATIIDVKTCADAVNPYRLGKKIANMGYESRAAFYERGLSKVRPELAGKIKFRHVWVEQDPPHAVLISEMDGAALTIGRKKTAAAIGLWGQYINKGTAMMDWPKFDPGPYRIEYPAWAETAWLDREMSDEQIGKYVEQELIAPDILYGG